MSNGKKQVGDTVLITADKAAREAVKEIVSELPGGLDDLTIGRGMAHLKSALESRPSIAVVDFDPRSMTMEKLEPLITQAPDTRFVLLCSALDSDLVLEAMQVGARHCMVKSGIPSELASVLKRLRRRVTPGDATGILVTVLSSGGGCGATTTAVNLADVLAEKTSEASLLIDLDLHYGSVATYLGLFGDYGVSDVLAQEGAIDAQLIRSAATAHTDRLSVLLSPATVRFDDPAALDFAHLGQALDACREAYRCTVIDAPRASMTTAAALAMQSQITLLVFELTVADVRTARNTLQALTDRGVPREQVLCVANRWRKRGGHLPLSDAREALGGVDIVHLTNDFESASKSVNLGLPLSKVAKRSALHQDIQELAKQVRHLRSAV